MTSEPITIRKAAATDIPAIAALQLRSMQALGGAYYPAQVLAGFLGRFGTMDFAVVDEGHFFVATDRDGRLLGTGGWSRRPPGYQQDAGRPGPRDVATVRGVYADPRMARSGIGSAVMRHVEADAARHGVARLTLTATLSGVALYARLGYRELARREIDLGPGPGFGCIDMMKPLKDADRRDAGAPATKPAGEAGRGAGIGAELSSAVLSATLLAATAFLLRSCLLGGPIIDMQL